MFMGHTRISASAPLSSCTVKKGEPPHSLTRGTFSRKSPFQNLRLKCGKLKIWELTSEIISVTWHAKAPLFEICFSEP